MVPEKDDNRERLKRIVAQLPRLNCGQCGFDNCGHFAVAVTEGRASPFGCRQDPSAGHQILKVLGQEAPETAAARTRRFPRQQPPIAAGARRFTTARMPVPAAFPSAPRFGFAMPPARAPVPEWHRGCRSRLRRPGGMRRHGAGHGCRRRWRW